MNLVHLGYSFLEDCFSRNLSFGQLIVREIIFRVIDFEQLAFKQLISRNLPGIIYNSLIIARIQNYTSNSIRFQWNMMTGSPNIGEGEFSTAGDDSVILAPCGRLCECTSAPRAIYPLDF